MIHSIRCQHDTCSEFSKKKIVFEILAHCRTFVSNWNVENMLRFPSLPPQKKQCSIFFLWMPWSKNVRLWTTWHLQVFFVRHLSHCLKSHFVVSVFEHDPLNLFLQDLWNLADLFGSMYFLHHNLHVEMSQGILIAPSFKTGWTYVSPNWNHIKGPHDCHFWISFTLTSFFFFIYM